jgi:tetratricopeptide (TPR) repeat protein
MEKGVVWCFLQILSDMQKAAGVSTNAREQLDVAAQILGDHFALNIDDLAQREQFALPGGRTLTDLYADAMKQKASDSAFAKFVEVLQARQFFAGMTEGTAEYEKRMSLAREHFAKAQAAKQQEEAEKHKVTGNTELAAGHYIDAAAAYTAAIAANPTNPVYYANRAAARTHLGKYRKAVADCEEAIRLAPNYARAYSRLGAALHSLGRYKEAIERGYDPALKLDPGNEAAQKNKSECARQMAAFQSEPTPEPAPAPAPASEPEPEPKPAPAPVPAPASTAPPSSPPPVLPQGLDMAGLFGMMQQPRFSELLQNPAIQQAAQQVMSNPELLSGILGGLCGAGQPKPTDKKEGDDEEKKKQEPQ